MKLLIFIFIATFEVYSFASEYQFGGNVVCNVPAESNYQKLNDETDLFDLPALKLLWRER